MLCKEQSKVQRDSLEKKLIHHLRCRGAVHQQAWLQKSSSFAKPGIFLACLWSSLCLRGQGRGLSILTGEWGRCWGFDGSCGDLSITTGAESHVLTCWHGATTLCVFSLQSCYSNHMSKPSALIEWLDPERFRYDGQKIYSCNILPDLLSYVFILKEAGRIQALSAECGLTCPCIYRPIFFIALNSN